MLYIVFDSLTGLSKKYAESLGYPVLDIKEAPRHLKESDRVFLVTRCFNFGEIPDTTLDFLDQYWEWVIGTACSGNRNWGKNYAIAGKMIEEDYGIPFVTSFEALGFPHEREKAKTFIDQYLKEKAQKNIDN